MLLLRAVGELLAVLQLMEVVVVALIMLVVVDVVVTVLMLLLLSAAVDVEVLVVPMLLLADALADADVDRMTAAAVGVGRMMVTSIPQSCLVLRSMSCVGELKIWFMALLPCRVILSWTLNLAKS